jgi:hypothetical protein
MLAGQGFLHVDASRELLLIPLREIPGVSRQDRRRIIDDLLSPILRHSQESLRER